MRKDNAERYHPNQESIDKITSLVDAGVSKKGRDRWSGLVPYLRGPFIDPVFIAASRLAYLIQNTSDPQRARSAIDFLNELAATQEPKYGVQHTLQTLEICRDSAESAKKNMEAALANPWVLKRFSPHANQYFGLTMGSFYQVPGEMARNLGGQVEVFPHSAYTSTTELGGNVTRVIEKSLVEEWRNWKKDLVQISGNPDLTRIITGESAEEFVDLLYKEPEIPGWGQPPVLRQPIDPSGETLGEFFHRIANSDIDPSSNLSPVAARVLSTKSDFLYFVGSNIFLNRMDIDNMKDPKKRNLFGAIQEWRDYCTNLLLAQAPNEELSRKVLRPIFEIEESEDVFRSLLSESTRFLHSLTIFPEQSESKNMDQRAEALIDYFFNRIGQDELASVQEAAYTGQRELFLPNLEARLAEIGVMGKFRDIVNFLRREYAVSWTELSGQRVSDFFTNRSTADFFKFIDNIGLKFPEATAGIWHRFVGGGLHFIPEQDENCGFIFDENDFANRRLGIRRINFQRAGELSDWRICVLIFFSDSYNTAVGGYIKDGRLVLRSDIADRLPPYFSALEHVTVANFYDLVRQRREESDQGKPHRSDAAPIDKSEVVKTPHNRPSRLSKLPRTFRKSTARNHREEKADFTTRIIDTHPQGLQGARGIRSLVQSYLDDLMEAGLEDRAILSGLYKEAIREANKAAHNISQKKAENVPLGMRLGQEIMPFPDEDGLFTLRALETWTLGHISPAMTAEERASLGLSLERRFRGSSAAWLDLLEYRFLETLDD